MVRINDSCIKCGLCVPYCPVNAINLPEEGKKTYVDRDECVECGTCYRSEVCPVSAIEYSDLKYPRSLRRHFSDPTSKHMLTNMPGRGTEEVKTNDVTNRFKFGEVGICVEVGRPGIGTSLNEVEKITKGLSNYSIKYEEKNPLVALFSNISTGEFKKEVLKERVLSIIIEFTVDEDSVGEILNFLKRINYEIKTVYSLSLAGRIRDDGSIPVVEIAKEKGIKYKPNAKINLGLAKIVGA